MAKTKFSKNKQPVVAAPTLSSKEQLIKKREAREARQKFINLAFICFFLGLFLGLPIAFLINLKVGLGIGLVIPSLILSYCYPRQALWFFTIYMPFSGTITYWIGGGNVLFQVSKDVFYIPALLALIQECRRKRKPILVRKEILPTLLLLLGFALMTLFFANGIQHFMPYCNTISEAERYLRDASGAYILDPTTNQVILAPCQEGIPFLQGLIGLKVLMGYIPLIFCAYYLIEDKNKLLLFGRLLVVLAIVCCLLALVQYWFLSSGRCLGTRGAIGAGLFKASLAAKCFVGGSLLYSPEQGQIRLPGTFLSPWHWAWFLIANSAICFTVAFSDTSLLWRLAGMNGMILVLINAVISGQRIALGLAPVLVGLLLILTGQIANLKRFIPAAIILTIALMVFVAYKPDFFQERINSLVSRWNTAPPQQFVVDQFSLAVRTQRGIFGRGLGVGTNATRTFGPVTLIETFHPKILFEMGYLGLGAFMLFLTHLMIIGFKSMSSLRDKSLRSFASSFWLFTMLISYFPYWYPLDTEPVAVYYWFFLGIIFRLPEIDKQEKEKLKALEAARGGKGKKRNFMKSRFKPQGLGG
jgi:hypothetical protein